MRVLAIGAHPDDVEWQCSGTLALCKERGDEIFIAVATNGNVGTGDPNISREMIAATRHKEAKAAADLLGAQLIWMDFDDEFLMDDRKTRERFIDAIREARPDVMFIHSVADHHPDHRLAGSIARDARIPASVPLVETKFPATHIPTVFEMDTELGNNFEPEFYVDVTSVIELKKALLNSHESQVAWMKHVFGTEFTENMMVQGRFRGAQACTKYAEGFKLLHDWPYTGDARLLPSK
jgi:LmbE family N-acetylglucosaminyl deacetylase